MGFFNELVKRVQHVAAQKETPLEQVTTAASLSPNIALVFVYWRLVITPKENYASWVHRSVKKLAPPADGEALDLAKALEASKTATEPDGKWDGFLQSLGIPNPNSPQVQGVAVIPDIKYGERPRNVLDVYVPTAAPEDASKPKPVLLFAHGGAWTSGDKWTYCPVAVRCAKEGIVAVFLTYTLYPEVSSDTQVEEISRALTWTFDNIARFGGDPEKIFLAGHSAGAQASAMMVLTRACALHRAATGVGKAGEGDTRLPYANLLWAGPHDISMQATIDGAVSVTEVPNGGPKLAPWRSPAVLYAALAAVTEAEPKEEKAAREEVALVGLTTQARKDAETLEKTPDLARSVKDLAVLLSKAKGSGEAADEGEGPTEPKDDDEAKEILKKLMAAYVFGSEEAGEEALAKGVPLLPASAADRQKLFPPTVLSAGEDDFLARWKSSIRMDVALGRLGLAHALLAYDKHQHFDNVWWNLEWTEETTSAEAKDILSLVTGKVDVKELTA